jgi:hypothetical protein
MVEKTKKPSSTNKTKKKRPPRKPPLITKVPKEARRIGRPPAQYDPLFHPEQAFRYALLMCTEEDMARLFHISNETFWEWKDRYPEFTKAIEDGGEKSDAEIANSLRNRATGYTIRKQAAFKVKKGRDHEVIEVVDLEEEVPAETKAIGLWLGNRQRKRWKANGEHPDINVNIDIINVMQKARARLNAKLAAFDGDDE